MKLVELIIQYRISHDLSQRQFAQRCNLSNGYISMLERGVNPSTGKPITPTFPQLQKLASGMGISLMELFEQVDDMPIDLSSQSFDDAKNAPTPKGERLGDRNVIRILGRNGSAVTKILTDEQLGALLTMVDHLPEADDL